MDLEPEAEDQKQDAAVWTQLRSSGNLQTILLQEGSLLHIQDE